TALAALALAACDGFRIHASGPGSAPAPNPTVVENERPGSPDWEITTPARAGEIEGYASRTSVNRGESIALFVSTVEPRYTIDVFRMGWYGGAGARRVAGPLSRPGIRQSTPTPDASTGLLECDWREPYRLATADDRGAWPSGVYLARLTASPSGAQAYIVFVVRDDDRPAPIAFQTSVTTYAAYNNWGGRSLYAFNSTGAPARKVSLDRPYAMNPYGVQLDGAGDFLRRWEYNTVRWLEREGYNVGYLTDVDTHERGLAPRRPRVYLSVGHDEYWSWAMREHVEAARDRGVALVFLGANTCFWQIRFEPSRRGEPDRTIVAYKGVAATEDPYAASPDPLTARLTTGRWREPPTSRPEAGLIGVQYVADPVDGDMVIADATHWAFEGTGLRNGDLLPGLLGYEVDAVSDASPPGLRVLAHSPLDQGAAEPRHSDVVIYQAPSGALVFATGSMYWSWGLDDYNAPGLHSRRVSAAAQQVTRNVLARMLAAR
ncbi:MAG TPA: N,N-dimethylformamidase beta subunit family domain-containing protein, partial [Methylomirabilota bacterium]|nr:N,N-dimethylformamidase beta subunit family domain-containing protein [Methylomirabilota bacterium]